MTDVPLPSSREESRDHEKVSLWRDAMARLRSNRLAVVGIVYVLGLVAVAIVGPWLTPYDFLDQNLDIRNAGPSMLHWFGTDDLGRDVLSRIIYGARTALFISVVVTAVALVIGVTLGAVAGYFGGIIDRIIMWLTDVTMSIPNLLLVVVLNTSLKPPIAAWWDRMYIETQNVVFRETIWIDFILVFGSLALILWPPYCRLVRGQVMTIRSRNYVRAGIALGLPNSKIIWRYIIPNAIGPLIVSLSTGLGEAMVLESAFSFLGVGLRPPMPSWGNMISDGLRVWGTYPHLLAAPALVLGAATVAFSFLGDGLNDALDPRGKK